MNECKCTGRDGRPKIRFFSRSDAKRAIARARGAGTDHGRHLRPYRCPDVAEFWHVTSNPTNSVSYYRERGMA